MTLSDLSARVAGVVTRHNLAVIAVMLVLTAGVGAGLPQLNTADQTGIDDDVFNETEVGQALTYMDSAYGGDENDSATAVSTVYVRPAAGNALSREHLVAALQYLQEVSADPAVERELVGDEAIRGPPILVGEHLAGENASLAAQQSAIQNASNETLQGAISEELGDREVAGTYLPRSYDPGATEAESARLILEFEQAGVTQQQEPLPDSDAQQVLYDAAADRPSMFTMGAVAQAEYSDAQITDVFLLIVPPALLLVLAVLAFAYRDLVDVLLGFVGVCLSLVWFFGLLGWLGIAAGFASIVGPVLIVALSIDFGLHVFMRYREQRGPEEAIRPAMGRSTASVLVAFLLVAVTAAVGFLSNVTNPVGFIRAFGIVITLGVLSAALLFVTLVPALKVTVDGVLKRYGVDRRRTALGTTGRLRSLLSGGVALARRGALAVLVLSVVAGSLGFAAYSDLDRQGFQQDIADENDWQTDLPGPVGWSAHETPYRQHLDYVQANYQSTDDRAQNTAFLIRGDVASAAALERLQEGTAAVRESEMVFRQGGEVRVVSPLSLLVRTATESPEYAALVAGVAEENPRFADVVAAEAADDEAFATAIESADPAPVDGDVSHVYDALSAQTADGATVLEREDGEYQSMRLIVPVRQGQDVNDRGEEMHRLADEIAGDSELSVVPVDFATVSNAGLGEIADSIIVTMLLAFLGVTLVLAVAYRFERGTATLGVVTVVPILVVVGLVFGAMALFDVPLTFVTAFLVSITIGLGIDYNIHVSDRFALERARGAEPVEALRTTVEGTGGALLGSALTSGAAFATLLLHPSPVFQSFGFIVVFALGLSFVVSVVVFPSILLLWARYVEGRTVTVSERTELTTD